MGQYLIEADKQEREALAIRRLLALDFNLTPIMMSLGLPPVSWCIIDIKYERLVNSPNDGDVDILAGYMAWNDKKQFEALQTEIQNQNPDLPSMACAQITTSHLIETGGVKWPPPTDYLVGIEAKCAFNSSLKASAVAPDDIKAGKTSHQKQRNIEQDIDKLLKMGFNKVAMFDIIVNPPMTSNIDGQAWFDAGVMAAKSAEAMSQKKMHSNSSPHTIGILQGRLPLSSPAGHWLIPMGAVDGADERYRGAGVPIELRKASDNPFLHNPEVLNRKEEMKKSLGAILGNFPIHRTLPVVFVCCRFTGKIYRYLPFDDVCILEGVAV